MSSSLILLHDSGSLAEMFKIENLDSDIGIIERDGYIPKTSSVYTYAKGANSDSFGFTVVSNMLKTINFVPKEVERLTDSDQIFVKLFIPGLPVGKTVGFRFPKEY